MTSPSSARRGLMSALCALVLTALAVALALPLPAAAEEGASPALIDASRTGSLHIVKRIGDPAMEFGDPTNPAADTTRIPEAGIEFSARRLKGFDLTTNEGWQQLAVADVRDFHRGGAREGELAEERTALTDDEGIAVFADLPIGAYYVTEVPGTSAARGLTLIEPFIVTVPRTDPAQDRTAWTYDVVVNAKNQRLEATKAAGEDTAAVGETIRFGISGAVPAPAKGASIERYEILDPLQQELRFVPGSGKVVFADAKGTFGQVELEEEDYSLTLHESSNHLVLSLNESGLRKLAEKREGNPDVRVTLLFDAELTQRPDKHRVRNRAYIFVMGYPPVPTEPTDHVPGVPTNEVIIRVPQEPAPSDPKPIPELPIPIPDPNVPGDHPGTNPGGQDDAPPAPEPAQPHRGALSQTGANVIGVGLLAVGLISLGVLLLRRKRA